MKHETNPAANGCTCGVSVIKYASVSTRGRYTLAEGLRLPLKPAFNTSGVGLKELCVCAAMFHLGHPPITTSSSSPPTPNGPTRHLLVPPSDAHRQTQAHNPHHLCPSPHPLSPPITHKLLPSLCSRGLMGNLLKVLACTELEHGPIVFLDFERETIRFFFLISFPLPPFFSLLHLLCFHLPPPPPIPPVLANHFPSSPPLFTPLSPSALLLLPLIGAPGTGIWLRSKGTYSHASHLVSGGQTHADVTTARSL